MAHRKALGWTLAALVAIALLVVFGLASSRSAGSGRAAPPLPHEQLVGTSTTLASLLAGAHGRPVAVVFWASWCPPCRHEAPALEQFSQSAYGRGRILGVDWSDGLSGARSFIRRYRWSFANLRDAEGTIGNAYGLRGLPTTFVLDRRGRIRAALVGPQDERSLRAAMSRIERS